ncbi:helix-turn-helix transcriptional regulator [Glaesserella parasuis]|uniref:Transcriptional regulator n=1 Tax=Glaesserella parasuis HPS9 TaxID=1450513 RepID=A0A836YWX2_GLAPU|nr:S24 family peptidase [Glaesserella parasuis]AWY45590.1 hypothetical protein B4U42_06240 [Glaesserella parasuis 29755]KDB44782.1 transcriptional regulator [Glaesserella parasuis HPS9]MCT8765874.1 helix-turn-helix transcriptional regulator [Glaesserella parasuis]MCT8770167.1 helix-turn-helix transcriptional regulator [Glaesserella parasuis]MCT8848195.1 helix-turn-helix transcriptional regulator [Glaesserella parasuis]
MRDIREIRRKKLKDLIDDVSGGNIADFARKIDKEPSYVARMLYPEGKPGAKPIGEKMAHHILHKFVLPLDWFNRDYDDEGELIPFEEPSIVIDVLNVEASAGNGSTGDLVEIVSKLHYVPEQFYLYFRGIDPENIRVINIKGDSMAPTFSSGDMIFIDISIPYFDGDGVYVFTYKNNLYVKRLQMAGDHLIVISDNETYKEWEINEESIEQLYIHGKVKVHQSQKLNFIG